MLKVEKTTRDFITITLPFTPLIQAVVNNINENAAEDSAEASFGMAYISHPYGGQVAETIRRYFETQQELEQPNIENYLPSEEELDSLKELKEMAEQNPECPIDLFTDCTIHITAGHKMELPIPAAIFPESKIQGIQKCTHLEIQVPTPGMHVMLTREIMPRIAKKRQETVTYRYPSMGTTKEIFSVLSKFFEEKNSQVLASLSLAPGEILFLKELHKTSQVMPETIIRFIGNPVPYLQGILENEGFFATKKTAETTPPMYMRSMLG
jgi:hypothetical protein